MMGYLVGSFAKKKKKILLSASVVSLILFLGENATICEFDLQKSNVLTLLLYPLVFYIFLLCLEYPMNDYGRYSKLCRKMASFIYYVHPLIIYFLFKFGDIKPTILFVEICILSSILGAVVGEMNNKCLNKLL